MVNMHWIKSIFSKSDPIPDDLRYELDKDKNSLHELTAITKKLEKMELTNKHNEEFLKLVTNSLESALWVKDTDCRFLFLNEVCAKTILKTTVDKALRLTDKDFEQDLLAPVCIESDKEVMDTRTVMRFIEHARYPERDLWLDVVKYPFIVNGKLIGVTGIARDITEIVSDEIKNEFVEVCSLNIGIDEEYCTKGGGKRKGDLLVLLEKNREEHGC